MKNGDKPAMPQLHAIDGNWIKEPLKDYAGLTKREYFAAMAMQGFIIRNDKVFDERFTDGRARDLRSDEIGKLSILAADELLKQLES